MGWSETHVLVHALLILVPPRITMPRESVYFTMDSYSTTIPVNFPTSEPVGRVYARTTPNDISQSLVYDILDTDRKATDATRDSVRKSEEPFEIDQRTGRVYLQQPLASRENIAGWNFTLKISAWAQRETSRVTVDFIVAVVEISRSTTCFNHRGQHTFRLKSDARNGPFGTLSPYSQPLQGIGGNWSYSFLSDNITDWLHIDNRTSEISLIRHPTEPLHSTNLTVQCSFETFIAMPTVATRTNQTQWEMTFVELVVEPVADCSAVIQYNRSNGDHITWVHTFNPAVRKWLPSDVILTGKFAHFYEFLPAVQTSSTVTPAHPNEKVLGELVLRQPLPWCFADRHTLALQLRDNVGSEAEDTKVFVQVEILALRNWTSTVLNLTLSRNAALYTRVAVVEVPKCVQTRSGRLENSLVVRPDTGLLEMMDLGTNSVIVYVANVGPLRNRLQGVYSATIRQRSAYTDRRILMEWNLQIHIVGDRSVHENTSCYESTCSHHVTRESCESDCGLGAPNGRCKWRQQVDPIEITANYSTCSPDFSTCPDRQCDALELQQKRICPQDCVVMQTVNIEAFMTMNANMVGIDQGVGPCSCEENGLRCMCKRSTLRKVTAMQATQPTTGVGEEPHTIRILAKPSQQVSPSARFTCTLCVYLIPVIAGSLIAAVLVLLYLSRGRSSHLCRRSCGQTYKPPVIVDSSDSRLSTVLSECSDDGLHLSKFSVTRLKAEFDPKWEFPRRNLVLDKVLGEGQFGRVVRAQALSLRGHTGYTTVAVKMLKGSYSYDDLQDLITEMNLLKGFNHHNVLKLLGVSTQKGPLYVIVEYCHHGCLRDFLRHSRQGGYFHDDQCLHEDEQTRGDDGRACFAWCNRNLVSFAWQICKGMQYVAMLKLVHRDLAARNILVSEDMVMKVSDFGLARDLYETGTYVKTSKSRIPMKWMAPESLFDNVYTTKTDIWSFGVLFWEIVTMGATPYPGISSNKLCQLLRQGHRLERPEGCAEDLYAVMKGCWHNDPNHRPDFDTLGSMLEQIMLKDSDYLDLSCSPFGDCSESEDLNQGAEDEQSSSAIPLLQIPSCEVSEGPTRHFSSLTKDLHENSSDFNLKKIMIEETSFDSGPLYGAMDPCRLYSNVNNNFISDRLSKTVSEPNLTVPSIFQ